MLCGTIIIDTGLRISLVYLIVGILDWAYQKHRFNEEMKMTKQEVREEFKNTEGNPEIKSRQRSRMRSVPAPYDGMSLMSLLPTRRICPL